jgi:hypothetical protein
LTNRRSSPVAGDVDDDRHVVIVEAIAHRADVYRRRRRRRPTAPRAL